jgi:hypothetical protein
VKPSKGKRAVMAAARTLAERRAVADARATQAMEVLRIVAACRRQQAALDALERMILGGRHVGFDGIAQIRKA